MMMFGYGNHWAIWQVALMWVAMIAFLSFVIWAIYALVTNATGRATDDARRGADPRHILDQRLAKGEIDAEDYQRLCDLIDDDDRNTVATGDRQ